MDLNDIIGKNRTILMGYAIIVIALYHLNIIVPCHIPYIKGIVRMGWYGVDIFLFLSGWGLYKSLSKGPNLTSYYKRRLLRIFPAYIITIIAFSYIDEYSLIEIIIKSSIISFWFGDTSILWYIPSIIAFYVFSPLLYKWVNNRERSIIPICITMPFVLTCWAIKEDLWGWRIDDLRYLFLARIPIFCFGMLIASKKITINKWIYKIMPLLTFAIFVIMMYVDRIDIYTKPFLWMIAFFLTIPISLTVIQLLNIFKSVCIQNLFHYCGIISLEIYLIHEHIYGYVKSTNLIFDFWNTTFLLFLIVIIAEILHISVDKIIQDIQKRLN